MFRKPPDMVHGLTVVEYHSTPDAGTVMSLEAEDREVCSALPLREDFAPPLAEAEVVVHVWEGAPISPSQRIQPDDPSTRQPITVRGAALAPHSSPGPSLRLRATVSANVCMKRNHQQHHIMVSQVKNAPSATKASGKRLAERRGRSAPFLCLPANRPMEYTRASGSHHKEEVSEPEVASTWSKIESV